MNDIIRRWLPPRVADLDVPRDDWTLYDDDDGGRTHYYSWYRWVANIAQPRVVAEIGVRLGYSAYSLRIAGVTETYIGFDNQCYKEGSNDIARRRLHGLFSNVLIHDVDTQQVDSLRPLLGPHVPQLFHVDGDHSEAACLHDLELVHEVIPAGGVIIADDSSGGKPPAYACATFLRRHPEYAALTLSEAFSLTGHHILVRLA